MAEEGIVTTRSATAITWKTVTPWPFMIPDDPGIEVLWDDRDFELVNQEIAGANEATYPVVGVGSRRPLTALVSGTHNTSGTAVSGLSTQRAQLKTNMKHLRDNLIAPVTSGAGVVTVELLGPGGSSLGSKNAQIIGPLRPVRHSPVSRLVTLDFWFPEGLFTL